MPGARTRGKPKEVSAGLPPPRPRCSRQSRPTQSPSQEMGTRAEAQEPCCPHTSGSTCLVALPNAEIPAQDHSLGLPPLP